MEVQTSSSFQSPDNSIQQLFEDATEKDSDAPASCCQKKCYGYRWTIIGMLALGMVVIHAQRVNVSVTLLAVYDNIENHVGNKAARESLPTTSWSASQIGLLHSGFFIGYLFTQIPAGIASYQFSPHRAFGISILISCALNTLIPMLIEKNIYAAVMTVRILQGMAEGFIWPASFVLVNNWSSRSTICRVSGFVATGSYAGLIIGFPLSGFITHYAGWQYIYYISGASGLIWCIFWLIFAYDKPDHHPKITEHELATLRQDKAHHYQYTSYKDIPWRSIATSKPFIAMCACGFAKGWVFNLLLMQEPTYIHVFGLSIAENGIWSALPFVFKLLVCYSSGFMADFLVNKLSMCRTRVRKLFNTLGFGIESFCLFSLSFIYDGKAAIAILSTGISLGGLSMSGWQTNHLDLAPRHAGILVALTQTFSNIAGIISPLVAGYFIQESSSLELVISRHVKVYDMDIYGWHMIFLVASLIVAICCSVYIVFGSGKEQDWGKLMEIPKEDQNISMRSDITTTVSYQTIKQSLEEDQ